MKALSDTNILVDHLNGVDAAGEEISRYDNPMISPITWKEVMVGTHDAEPDTVRSLLSRFHQVDIDAKVAETAATARCSHRMHLPGAIIRTSAQKENPLLSSRNTRDFPVDAPGMRMPYAL